MSDLRIILRGLVRQPALNVLAVVALGLGIGLTATMFSIVYGVVWRGLPFERPEQLVHIARTDVAAGISRMRASIHDFVEWRAQQQGFEDLAAFHNGDAIVTGNEGRPERLDGTYITPAAFRLLRVQPLIGRTFVEHEQGATAPDAVVLSHHVWRDLFGSDPAVVGRIIQLNATPTVVIGVMPDGFAFPYRHDLWMPLRLDAARVPRGEGAGLEVFGRLRDDVAIERATAELNAIAARLAAQDSDTNKGIGVVTVPYAQRYFGGQGIVMMYAMLGAVLGVLAIACVNVANLLLARLAYRTRQIAVQTTLGATVTRIVRQLLMEALVLALLGAALGVGLARLGVLWFNRTLVDHNPPFWLRIELDLPSILFVIAIVGLSAALAGLAPAFRASRTDVVAVLKDDARSATSVRAGRLSRALVVAQVALSCALLAGASLMIRGVIALKTSDWGFAADRIVTAGLALPERPYGQPASRRQFYDRLLVALGETTGVRHVALSTALPALGTPLVRIIVEGRTYASPREQPMVHRAAVTPGFFDLFEVALQHGRLLTTMDREESPGVAVVNASFVRHFLAGQEPVGRRFRPADGVPQDWLTIVGVVADAWMDDVAHPSGIAAGYYVPLAQAPAAGVSVSVSVSVASGLRRAVQATDPTVAVSGLQTMRRAIEGSTWFYGVFATLFGAFGVAAFLLAMTGLYGVLLFTVKQRTREIGVRMALGARASDVMRLILRQGVWPLGLGLAMGLLLAGALGRMLAMVIYGLGGGQAIALASVAIALTMAGLLATFVPARRAMRINPIVALRDE